MCRLTSFFVFLCVLGVSVISSLAQETPPLPSSPKSVKIPAVQTAKLPNGMKIAVIHRQGVPLVSVNLLIDAGAYAEDPEVAGVANLTATLLTKGTKTRSATQIAEAIEFLGGDLVAGAGWNATNVSLTVTSDKLAQALVIMADVVRNPKFSSAELDLVKSQALDGLTYNLKQPSFLSGYVASKFAFDEYPAGGTPESLALITTESVSEFYKERYVPDSCTLVFAGDISLVQAKALAAKSFSTWKPKELIRNIMTSPISPPDNIAAQEPSPTTLRSILVIDLPKSGQASVSYVKRLKIDRVDYDSETQRVNDLYYSGLVLNSVLGGGYSSRLNYEIRIKRGLSYGAGSNIAWRFTGSNFATRAQTKNESAPEVATLVLDELTRLTSSPVPGDELVPRKSVLTGGFGRNLETTSGLAGAVADLIVFEIPTTEMNVYFQKVNAVTASQISDLATKHLLGGDIIIVGDYSIFKDDLAKRFPGITVDVIKADELDLSKDNLRK